ncbi:FAD-dependent oxidoreductase, partial [Klebsiella pneumoniae]|nr:FAD-dependent oxidoreductase [Klebsiella pneumoniae]
MTRRLVVIGNGMAATRLVQRLVERDPARFAITVVGDEPHPAYNRIQLSPLLAGEKTAAQIPLLPAEWYTRHGVCLRSGEAVDEVDIQQRRLRIAETWLPWDELVFATGSRPFIPPLPGIDRPQVMPFRTLADVERILAIPGPAVVIGGGVLGVEAAAALRRHGGEVTLLHRGSGLMAPLTDAFAADELRQQLEARGIRCVLECRIAAIDADGVRLADGRVFRAARVVLATGVQPDSRLAAQSGVLCQRGIVVDRQMASSLPGISAIGECCEIDGQTWGLVAPCLRQAEVLADRLCGAPGEGFVWQDAGTRLKVTGIELFSAGEQQAGEQDDIYTSWDPIDRHYRRLLLRDGRLRGVLLMGDCTAAAALTARLESDEPATVDWLFDPSSTQPQAAGIMTMTKPVLVLVGHGMVGHHFLEQCVSRNLHQQYRIVVFGEERYPAYDRVHLSEYFAGRSAESLSLAAGDFFI